MTAVVVWKRKFKQGPEELCFASDSRLRGDGRVIDSAPKIFPLQRGDIALAFAGETAIAYPFLCQVINASNSYRASRTRGLDIIEYRSHIIKLLNQLVQNIRTSIVDLRLPDVTFIVGGYSWIRKEFCLWLIRYKHSLKRFHFDSPKSFGEVPRCILFAGDRGIDLRREFLKLIHERNGKRPIGKYYLDFEPFEALIRILRTSNSSDTIGGPPQLLKIYQHLNSISIPVFWPNQESKTITLLGRQLLSYERVDEWPLDPDTMQRRSLVELNLEDGVSANPAKARLAGLEKARKREI